VVEVLGALPVVDCQVFHGLPLDDAQCRLMLLTALVGERQRVFGTARNFVCRVEILPAVIDAQVVVVQQNNWCEMR
jgi:hypothetical protein